MNTNKEIYENLIKSIESGVVFSMCAHLAVYHPTERGVFLYQEGIKGGIMEKYFPELWAQRPQENFDFSVVWFTLNKTGMQSRKECLLKAIELCNTKQQNNEN